MTKTRQVNRRGIILAGGAGTRLYPITMPISKQLLPVFNKPMIYYPLTTLMLGGMRDILLISTPHDIPKFEQLLGNGSQFGINISYKVQPSPDGLAQAFILGEQFIGNNPSTLILGDNIFYGSGLQQLCLNAEQATQSNGGACVFAYHVHDPERYGVAEFDKNGQVISLEEKPQQPKSNFAVVGLYYYDEMVVDYAKSLQQSARGELEITDLNKVYLQQNALSVQTMRRGFAWFDAGTHDSLLEASQFIATLEKRTGLLIASPEEVALRMGFITPEQCHKLGAKYKNDYGKYLQQLAGETRANKI